MEIQTKHKRKSENNEEEKQRNKKSCSRTNDSIKMDLESFPRLEPPKAARITSRRQTFQVNRSAEKSDLLLKIFADKGKTSSHDTRSRQKTDGTSHLNPVLISHRRPSVRSDRHSFKEDVRVATSNTQQKLTRNSSPDWKQSEKTKSREKDHAHSRTRSKSRHSSSSKDNVFIPPEPKSLSSKKTGETVQLSHNWHSSDQRLKNQHTNRIPFEKEKPQKDSPTVAGKGDKLEAIFQIPEKKSKSHKKVSERDSKSRSIKKTGETIRSSHGKHSSNQRLKDQHKNRTPSKKEKTYKDTSTVEGKEHKKEAIFKIPETKTKNHEKVNNVHDPKSHSIKTTGEKIQLSHVARSSDQRLKNEHKNSNPSEKNKTKKDKPTATGSEDKLETIFKVPETKTKSHEKEDDPKSHSIKKTNETIQLSHGYTSSDQGLKNEQKNRIPYDKDKPTAAGKDKLETIIIIPETRAKSQEKVNEHDPLVSSNQPIKNQSTPGKDDSAVETAPEAAVITTQSETLVQLIRTGHSADPRLRKYRLLNAATTDANDKSLPTAANGEQMPISQLSKLPEQLMHRKPNLPRCSSMVPLTQAIPKNLFDTDDSSTEESSSSSSSLESEGMRQKFVANGKKVTISLTSKGVQKQLAIIAGMDEFTLEVSFDDNVKVDLRTQTKLFAEKAVQYDRLDIGSEYVWDALIVKNTTDPAAQSLSEFLNLVNVQDLIYYFAVSASFQQAFRNLTHYHSLLGHSTNFEQEQNKIEFTCFKDMRQCVAVLHAAWVQLEPNEQCESLKRLTDACHTECRVRGIRLATWNTTWLATIMHSIESHPNADDPDKMYNDVNNKLAIIPTVCTKVFTSETASAAAANEAKGQTMAPAPYAIDRLSASEPLKRTKESTTSANDQAPDAEPEFFKMTPLPPRTLNILPPLTRCMSSIVLSSRTTQDSHNINACTKTMAVPVLYQPQAVILQNTPTYANVNVGNRNPMVPLLPSQQQQQQQQQQYQQLEQMHLMHQVQQQQQQIREQHFELQHQQQLHQLFHTQHLIIQQRQLEFEQFQMHHQRSNTIPEHQLHELIQHHRQPILYTPPIVKFTHPNPTQPIASNNKIINKPLNTENTGKQCLLQPDGKNSGKPVTNMPRRKSTITRAEHFKAIQLQANPLPLKLPLATPPPPTVYGWCIVCRGLAKHICAKCMAVVYCSQPCRTFGADIHNKDCPMRHTVLEHKKK